MAIVGSIDHKLSTSDPTNSAQESFKILFDFFNTTMVNGGNCTRIALHHGYSGGSWGTGTDFHDGANPFGENALAVFTFNAATNPFDVLIQWGVGAQVFGSSPGNPGNLNGSASAQGLGIALAYREDDSSPWAGGTANAGADTKGATVWTPGGSTLHVIDRACSQITPNGSYATNRENCLRVNKSAAPLAGRMHMIGDENSFAIFVDQGDAGIYTAFFAGQYALRSGLSASTGHDHPLFAWGIYEANGVPTAGSTYGTAAGTGSGGEGGILGRKGDYVGEAIFLNDIPDLFTTTYQPNQQPTTPELDEIALMMSFAHTSRYGYLGYVDPDIAALVFNVANNSTNSAADKAYLANTTTADWKYAIPWDGGAAPGVGGTRAGRQFTL